MTQEEYKTIISDISQKDLEREIGMYECKLLKKRNHSTGIYYLTEKDISTISRHFANWLKEQMMKKAITTTMQIDECDDLVPTLSDMSDKYLEGDNVRVIIIKEE